MVHHPAAADGPLAARVAHPAPALTSPAYPPAGAPAAASPASGPGPEQGRDRDRRVRAAALIAAYVTGKKIVDQTAARAAVSEVISAE